MTVSGMGIMDVARIHMVVLSFLATGLLISISYFEKLWNDLQGARGNEAPISKAADKAPEKTD